MNQLYAHHKTNKDGTIKQHGNSGSPGGNGNGNGNNVPEIDGGSLILAILFVVCFWKFFKKNTCN